MFVLQAHIEIGDYTFSQVQSLRITRSVDLIGDTAVIELPTHFVLGDGKKGFQKSRTTDAIAVSNRVSIRMGYAGVIDRTEFVGVVTAVRPNVPVSIHCADASWHLRQKNCNKNFTKTTLRAVMAYILAGQEAISLSERIPELSMDKCILKDKNGLQALQQLKQSLQLSIFLDDRGALFACPRRDQPLGKAVDYKIGCNVIRHNLEFKTRAQAKVSVKLIGMTGDNRVTSVEQGEAGGARYTWHQLNLSDAAELKKIAASQLDALQYEGYRGTLTSFLTPFADRGMTANLCDERYPERAGSYFIPRVDITYGVNGGRRIVELGRQV
ncbi:MAG: late control protein [Flavobacteriales bacterium]